MKNILICLILLCSLPTFSQAALLNDISSVRAACYTGPFDSMYVSLTQNAKLDSIVADALRGVYADPELKVTALGLPKDKPYNWKRAGLTFGLGLIAGVSMGFHETAVHRPSAFPDHWNKNYWDNSQSWNRKWKNGDPAQGPAYFGSASFLAWTVDAKHTFGTAHRVAVLGTGICIGFGEKRPLWQYGADLVAGFFGYSLGFGAIWDMRIYGK